MAALNRSDMTIEQCPIEATRFGELLARIADQTISGNIAKHVFAQMWESDKPANTIIEEKGLKQVTDSSAIESLVDAVIAESSEQVEQYRGGNQKVLGYLVGQIMKRSQGKANPKQVNQILRTRLES